MKKIFIIVAKVLIIGIIIALCVKVYSVIRAAIATHRHTTDNKGNLVTIPVTKAKALCARVIDDCYWFSSDATIYSDLNELADGDLIFVSNIFASDFRKFNDNLSLQAYIYDNKIFGDDVMISLNKRLLNLTKND